MEINLKKNVCKHTHTHTHTHMQEMWVQSLDWKDLLEKEMETHFSILAWEIPWTEGPGRL